MSNVFVNRGTIIVYRIFDVAEELDLERIEASTPLIRPSGTFSPLTRGEGQTRSPSPRVSGERVPEGRVRGGLRALIVRHAPITLALGAASIRLGSSTAAADLFARVWSYGVVSIQFRLPIERGTAWETLVQRAALVEGDNDIDAVAAARVREVAGIIAAAATLPHEPQGMEDYVIYLLEELAGVEQPSDLASRADIPALILGEPAQTLSADVRKPILDSALSYSTRDLAVIDWNSALVIDPSGSRDVVDILEFAVTHLMEFRYFDTLLDERLESLYEAIQLQRRFRSFFRSDYERLSREASSLFLEFSEYVERVENSLKFVGDFFLAAVFRRATARFQLREWEESVARKLNTLARVSEVLSSEINARRSHWLEIVVIALILYEIVSAAVMAMR